MKFLVVLAVAVACASADYVKSAEFDAPIVKASYDLSPEGSFSYQYETGNGIYGAAQGTVKNLNSEYPSLEITGANKYTSPEGVPVETTYVADENGYRATGSHIPVAPEIPELIARSLAYIAAHPPPVVPEPYKKA